MAETPPVRLTLSRRKGFNLQHASCAINGLRAKTVARPGRWGNPFVVSMGQNRADCVARYTSWLNQPAQATLRASARHELQGFNLACWCPAGTPCHADVLLRMVNDFPCDGDQK